MVEHEWSESTLRYPLSGGLALERADPPEFAVRHALAQNASPVFLFDWDRTVAMVADNAFLSSKLFWITRDDRRVGGTIVWPNTIAALFLEPPWVDLSLVIKALVPLLLHWSDLSKDITAISVLPAQREHYQRVGFRLDSASRCMIRATEHLDVCWEDGLRLSLPGHEDLDRVAELAYIAHTDRAIVELSSQGRQAMIRHYLDHHLGNELANQASTLISEDDSGDLIGACLISLWEGWPLVFDLVVHPANQGRGLAKRMLQKALTVLHPAYPAIRLFVGVGNSAESLYYHLGFLPGPEMANLKLHVPGRRMEQKHSDDHDGA